MLINIIVSEKPDIVRVLDGSGNQLVNDTTLAPKKERAELELICEAIGGKPVPKVLWLNGTSEMTRGESHYATQSSMYTFVCYSCLQIYC